jgi:hypothetical protein
MNRPKGLFKIASLTFSAASILLLPGTANATITFQYSQTPGVDIYQQTTNNPCVIGDPSCKEPSGMFYDKNSGAPGPGSYDLFSTVYLAAASNNFGLNQIPLGFIVGVDDNFSNDHEVLVAFNTYDCGTGGPLSSADSSAQTTKPAGCTSGTLDQANSWNSSTSGFSLKDMSLSTNGNGFSNFILKGFSLTAGHYYVFEASVNPDNDGFEEFFIIPAGSPPAVPEPVTSALVGTGLVALFYVRRRRASR